MCEDLKKTLKCIHICVDNELVFTFFSLLIFKPTPFGSLFFKLAGMLRQPACLILQPLLFI